MHADRLTAPAAIARDPVSPYFVDAKRDDRARIVFDGDHPIAPPHELVKGLLPFDGVVFIAGQSGAGKTFVAIDLAVALATGRPFFGRAVRERVGTAIIAAEGEGTIAARLAAAKQAAGLADDLPIATIGSPPDLMGEAGIGDVIRDLLEIDKIFRARHGVRLGVVIIDTLAAAFGLADENDNAEAAKAVRHMRTLGSPLNALVVAVHHFGKSEDAGLRGASAWRAAADAVVSVLADRNHATGEVKNRRLALAKSRTSEEGLIGGFDLQFVRLGYDRDGQSWGGMTVAPADADGRPDAKRTSRACGVFVEALNNLDAGHFKKIQPVPGGPEVRAVLRDTVRAEFYRLWPARGESEARRQAARRRRFTDGHHDARKAGLIAERTIAGIDWIWKVDDG